MRNAIALTLSLASACVLLLAGCSNIAGSGDAGITRMAVVANSGDNTVTIFDANHLTPTHAAVPVSGSFPWEITLSTDDTLAYVMNRDSDNISVIDIQAGTEIGTIALSGDEPAKSVIASDGYLYVTFRNSALLAKVDIAADPPVQDSTIDLSASSCVSIAQTPDGSFLYVGGYALTAPHLCKIDIAAGAEIGTFDNEPIVDLVIDGAGTAYCVRRGDNIGEVYLFDTHSDTWGSTYGMTTESNFAPLDLIIYGSDLFIAVNGDEGTGVHNRGGVVQLSKDFDDTGFLYDSADDGEYSVVLPFTFTFDGTGYDTVYHSSNGSVGMTAGIPLYTNIDDVTGFAVVSEDMDSSLMRFNYTSRTFADHAVFQWCTGTHNFDGVMIAEIVLFSSGQARFDYLFSTFECLYEDGGFTYGVGNGSTALVNLRAAYGSAFRIAQKSFLWDPAAPTSISSVPFTWEGTGQHYMPAHQIPNVGLAGGVAVTDAYVFIPVSDTNEVTVYDRSTMRPLDAPVVVVGHGPAAIVVATP